LWVGAGWGGKLHGARNGGSARHRRRRLENPYII